MTKPLIDGSDNRLLASEVRDLAESLINHVLDSTLANMSGKQEAALTANLMALKDARKLRHISALVADGKYDEAMTLVIGGKL